MLLTSANSYYLLRYFANKATYSSHDVNISKEILNSGDIVTKLLGISILFVDLQSQKLFSVENQTD